MESLLARSYAECRRIARTQARNFYYSFLVLPPEKQAQMCAVYAFMRYCDDLSDEEGRGDKAARLCAWRQALERALAGNFGENLILPAFQDTVARCGIPARFLHDVIDGAEMDLTTTRYETFKDLRQYCYRVAGAVGLVCIHVWGFDGGVDAYKPAESCGLAFQLTNILRDVREDAQRGRIYLPREDLRRFNLTDEEILSSEYDDRFRALMRFEADRAEHYYREALVLERMLHPVGRPTFRTMWRIYHELLRAIIASDYRVLDRRIRVSTARKVGILAQEWLAGRLTRSTSAAARQALPR